MEDKTAQRRIQNISGHLAVSVDRTLESSIASSQCSNVQDQSPLDNERKNASFDPLQLTYVLDGGQKITEIKDMVVQVIQNDPDLYNPEESKYDLTRPQLRERTMAKVKRVVEIWGASNNSSRDVPRSGKKTQTDETKKAFSEAFWWALSLYDRSWATRVGVHFGLFMSAIAGQGTEEQQKRFLDDIFSMRIVGCFAMTELGHGSYIRGLETTGTYDKQTKEFIINSPTETSTKFWIGMAGQTATHTAAYARLIIDGKDYGIHTFVVPLRSTVDGAPLPGISVGDCGAKMGRDGLDNGWIQFNNVRIPRENLLMRWAQVSPEGVYTSPPKAQLNYASLIGVRIGIIRDSSDFAKVALTIATRYSAVRKQFPDSKGDNEEQIINYQTHQFRLMPLLATCFAYHFTSNQMNKQLEDLNTALNDNNLSSLPGVHATSAGLKAFSTWWCNEAIEQCRQCLGGHGYSAYSGLSSLLADFAVNCSWEGDNTVLAQQTAKYLIKSWKKSKKGTELHGFEKYLQNIPQTLATTKFTGSTSDLLKPEAQLQILLRLATKLIDRTATRLQKEKDVRKNKQEAWNECMVDLVLCARVHCDAYVFHCFFEAVKGVKEPSVKKVLKKLLGLQALWTMERYLGYILEDGFLSGEHVAMVREQTRIHCKELRSDAVALVDSFHMPDFVINSPLGRYDGQVYKHYLETVKKAPNAIGRPSYWENLIKPLTNPTP